MTLNGDLITTFKREELEGEPVEDFIEKLERGWARGVPGAKCDDLYVLEERFSLVIGSEVMHELTEEGESVLVTDYFADGEGPIRITLVKQSVEEAEYSNERREAELEVEWGWHD